MQANLFHHQQHNHQDQCLESKIVTVNGVSQLFATLLSHLFELVFFSSADADADAAASASALLFVSFFFFC